MSDENENAEFPGGKNQKVDPKAGSVVPKVFVA